jgi:serine/threonine-protein kinase RsbW
MIERTFSSAERVAEVRFWVAEFCTKAEVSQVTVEDAVLVVSELVTNTLRHTRSGEEGGHYTVRLRRGSSRVLLEVSDQGAATFPMVRRSDNDGPLPAHRGHGLRLVDACAYGWWVRGD